MTALCTGTSTSLPENAVSTALQTERVEHLRGSLAYNVEVLCTPAQGLTPRICLLPFQIFSLFSFLHVHRNTSACPFTAPRQRCCWVR